MNSLLPSIRNIGIQWDRWLGSATVLDFLNIGKWSEGLNDTYMALIPKKSSPSKFLDFMLISLCNVLYKIIAKVMANRLKHILPDILSPTQSAFVPSRLITDNVIVAFESMHSMKIRMRGREGFMILKLGMSNAYDRIEWSFLISIMEKLGFANRWIDLTMKYVSSVSYSLLINRVPQPKFSPTRGIMQRDPFSPTLHTLHPLH